MSRWHSGRNKRWIKTRLTVLNEEKWKCRICGLWANEVDHIQPVSDGGAEYERDNLQALCTFCHVQKTRTERHIKQASFIPGATAWDLLLQQSVREKDF